MKELLEHRTKLSAMILASGSYGNGHTRHMVRCSLESEMRSLDKLIAQYIDKEATPPKKED